MLAAPDTPTPPWLTVMAGHPFLAGMSAQHLQVLADCAMLTEFRAGQLIFREGDVANRFYLIRTGTVALEAQVRDQGAVGIHTLGAGDVLGWSWLFPPYYWHFDARALEVTHAFFFYGTRLRERCEADHELGYDLLRRVTEVVIRRLQATRHRLVAGGLHLAGTP